MKRKIMQIGRKSNVELKAIPGIGSLAKRIELWASEADIDNIIDNLYIGNHAAAMGHYTNFDVTISVGRGANEYPADHYYPLEVHDTNQYELFCDAVDRVREYYQTDKRALVHCHEGRERAPSVVITAIAAEHGCGWGEASDHVHLRRQLIEPPKALCELGEKYLRNHGKKP